MWSLIVILSGLLTSAVAQTRPADSDESSAVAIQNPLGDGVQAEGIAIVDPGQKPGLVHIVPFGRVGSAVKNGFAPGGAHLTYWGGPVISNIHAIVVLWGPNVNTAIGGTPGIAQFFGDITTSRYYDLLSEYSTVGVTGAGTPAASSNQAIGHGVFDGQFTITPSLCPGPTACTVADAQVAAELATQITAGHLPQPVTDSQGNVNSFYMIYFPPGVTITLDPVTKSCVQFCAYHSNTPANLAPKFVPYGVEPDFAPPSACALGCGGNPALFDNVTEVTSHEMSEAVTDALVGSAATTAPPLAWYDPNPVANPLGEIGDICVGQAATVSAGNATYVVQQEFSNLQNDCVSAPPVFNLSNSGGGIGPSLPFHVTLTIQSSVNASTLSSYAGTVHFTSSDPQAVLPADYTFLSSDGGSRLFSITLNTPGNQTITVVDTRSSGFSGSLTVNVNTTPDLAITKTHSGNFILGQTGATYTIAASNIGGGATSGTVTVKDTLPSGLTATAISGLGWTCTLGTLACTRSDAFIGGSSYPAIIVTVNVAANAPTSVSNTATVSGGGETNTANDVANDLTSIISPITDLAANVGGNAAVNQGDTGRTVVEQVSNIGSVASTGVVTATTTLGQGLSATAISGSGWSCTLSTLTCTRSDSVTSGSSYPQINVTFNVSLNASASAPISLSVSGGGDANAANNTSTFTLTVSQVVSIIANTPSVAVTAGQPATFVFNVSAGSAAGAVAFSCSGLPTASSCTFSPASLTAATANVTMTVTTTARATAIGLLRGPSDRNPLLFVVLLFLAAFATFFLSLRGTRARKFVPTMGIAGILIVITLAGCGGGNPPPPPPLVTGTPAGAFAVTFTATGPGGTASKAVNLTVR
ncbi:MAG TPA: hypothetical protein VIK39_01065 [Candidatus Angelobacter sp.]